MLALVLITYGVAMQRNSDANKLLSIQRANERCREISGVITKFNAGQDYTETKLEGLEKDVRIEKGSIIIKSTETATITCRYTGTAWLEETENSYKQDSEGFNLVKESSGESIAYKVKRLAIGVVFCNYAENWCSGLEAG